MADEDTLVTDTPAEPPAPAPEGTTEANPEPKAAPAAPEPAKGTLADSDPPPAPEKPQDWPDDWQDRAIKSIAGEDEKEAKRLAKIIGRYNSPAEALKAMVELRTERDSGKLVRRPATRATEEEMAQFRKALGVPDEPAGYLDNIKLSNDRVLGDDDKPIVETFANRLHKHNVTPAAMSEMVDTYFEMEQARHEAQVEADAAFKVESAAKLKQEMGAEFTQVPAVLGQLKNDFPVIEKIFYARDVETGQIVGNMPEALKALYALGKELYPHATMHGGGENAGQSIDTEIAELESFMRSNRAEWFKDEKKQARHRELLDMKARIQSRSAA